jgi:hypothetical protein
MNPFEVGAGVGETIEGIALLLSQCWLTQSYRTSRPADGILDQEVDKTALLFMNSWLHSDLKKKAPFAIRPGRHGPGPGLRGTAGRFFYICDVIEEFQAKLPEKYWLFEIVDGDGPWRHFDPKLTHTDWDRWCDDKQRAGRDGEVRFIQEFGNLLRMLTSDQVISLGRHLSSDDTYRALLFLFGEFENGFKGFLNNSSGDAHSWWSHLDAAYESAREAFKKVGTDQDHYRTAWKEVRNAPDSDAKSAVLKCRPACDDIWGAKEVSSLSRKAGLAHHLATVIWAAVRLWAQEQGVTLPGRRLHDPQETVPETLAKQLKVLEQTQDFPGMEVLVGKIRTGKLSSCHDSLRESLEMVMSV